MKKKTGFLLLPLSILCFFGGYAIMELSEPWERNLHYNEKLDTNAMLPNFLARHGMNISILVMLISFIPFFISIIMIIAFFEKRKAQKALVDNSK